MKKLNSLFRILLVCTAVLLVQSSFAQQTGSFDKYITFEGTQDWDISYFVPVNYNPALKYKLIIGLHGLGDTPQNYRDNMAYIDSIPGSNMYGAIWVCPYGGGYQDGDTTADYADFWTTCDTSIITRCIMDVMSAYNIDQKYVYLSGFSIGGRAALRYGLLNYSRFRGLELWTPAIQTLDEANNLDPSFTYVWQNGQHIPINISVGGVDTYAPILTTAYQHLSDAGALANFHIYFGMGHEPPPAQYVESNFNYLDSNATSYAMNDAGISSIGSPFEEVCSSSFTPVVTIQNKGLNNLTSAIINYQVDNGTINTYNWSGNLIELGKNKIILPAQTVSAGAHTFKAYTTMPNGVADTVPSNDGMTENFNSITYGVTSISEGFEGPVFPPTGWRQAGSDTAWGWKSTIPGDEFSLYVGAGVGPSGPNEQSTNFIFFDNEIADNLGKHYSIRTPQVDFTTVSSPTLTYNYAYSPYRDTSASGYVNKTINIATGTDTLAVYYSTDCGSTWNILLKKGGLDLSTTGGYLPGDNLIFVPTTAGWMQQTIDLNLPGLIGQGEVMFSFENISGYGHLMYLDNININAVTGIVNETKVPVSVNIYPNPNNGSFTLSFNARNEGSYIIQVSNILGQTIYAEMLSGFSGDYSKQLDMKAFGSSMYFVRIKTQDNEVVKKVIVY